jgi:hypothetical protein
MDLVELTNNRFAWSPKVATIAVDSALAPNGVGVA